jgi:hypothetical protein
MSEDQASAGVNTNLWAFLVGINQYKSTTLNTLRGCVNDVEAMRDFLIKGLNVDSSHIKLLKNDEASHDAILQQFEAFLINNSDIPMGAQILFHYSGHGSQMAARPEDGEPDGLNETIVPHDSRTDEVYDISDKRLAWLLRQLAKEKGDNITVILDSCHSGSGTRAPFDPVAPSVRRAPIDDRPLPPGFDADLPANAARSADSSASGWIVGQNYYVLLAGCRDHEESYEYWDSSGDSGAWHGAMTCFLLRNLPKVIQQTTYFDLYRVIAAQVNAEYPQQMPQCEGDRNRLVFGGVRVNREPVISVEQVGDDGIILDAGLVLGLRQGTKLALYFPARSEESGQPQQLASVEVTQAGATQAQARIVGVPSGPIVPGTLARITEYAYGGIQATVFLKPGKDQTSSDAIAQLRNAIQTGGPGAGSSPYLHLLDSDNQPADLQVEANGDLFNIYRAGEVKLLGSDDIDAGRRQDPRSTVRVLETIARFLTFQRLSNDDPSSRLTGKVKVDIRQRVDTGTTIEAKDLGQDSLGSGGERIVRFAADHADDCTFVVDVTNQSDMKIYPHVFILSPDYSIKRIYPNQGQDELLHPGKTLSVGLRAGDDWLREYLPVGWSESHDSLRVVVTTEFADLAALEQEGLDVAPPPPAKSSSRRGSPDGTSPRGETQLDHLLDRIMSGTRFGQSAGASRGADWGLTALAITVVRVASSTELPVDVDKVDLGSGVTLEKPQDFTGQATISTASQISRSAGQQPSFKTPPGIATSPDMFAPVTLATSRGSSEPQLAISFTLEDTARGGISPENPLVLHLPASAVQDAVEVLPIVFDGEDYLLAGYSTSEPNTVKLVALPQTVGAGETETEARGTVHTLRLFLFKKLGITDSSLGLHRAELREGEASDVHPEQFKAGERVAVLVHGFNGDSKWMVAKVADFLRSQGPQYDHFITYDYESFGTGIKANGQHLADLLQAQCGFGLDDHLAVDVYAHSMGCLVSRCMIELSGGNAFVDRLVMAGGPNRGTVLANISRGFVFLTTWLLNMASVVPPVAAAGKVLEKLFEQGVGLQDLQIDSAALQELNNRSAPSNVPYLAMAGNYEPDDSEKSRLKRLAEKVMDTAFDDVFREPNDLALTVSSGEAVRGGKYPLLQVKELPCSHTQYFDIPAGREAIESWLAGG